MCSHTDGVDSMKFASNGKRFALMKAAVQLIATGIHIRLMEELFTNSTVSSSYAVRGAP